MDIDWISLINHGYPLILTSLTIVISDKKYHLLDQKIRTL